MDEAWSAIVRRYRLRHGLTQQRLAEILQISQRTVSRWERGEDAPSLAQQKILRDLTREPNTCLSARLPQAVAHCPMPRALTRSSRINLHTMSRPALLRRPALSDWMGRDLAPIATGILAQMLDDRCLQRGIARGEIACVRAIIGSALVSDDPARVGTSETTFTYFFLDGTLYADVISAPTSPDAACGYRAISMDEVTGG